METNLIQIGNSQGIRLPKTVIEQAGLNGPLQLDVTEGTVVIRAKKKSPREGWAEAAAEIAACGADDLEDWNGPINDFHGDWTWP